MRRMQVAQRSMVGVSLIATFVAAMVLWAWCSADRSSDRVAAAPVAKLPDAEGSQVPDWPSRTASNAPQSLEAGDVRILVQPPNRPERLVCQVQHLGPLLGEDLQSLQAKLSDGVRQREAALLAKSGFEKNPTSWDMVLEARESHTMAVDKDAIEAIAAGSYVVTASNAPAPPLSVPGCEVVMVGHSKDGLPCNVTVMMPHRTYTRSARAREYMMQVVAFDDSEKAQRFNALPDQERLPLAAHLTELLRKSPRSHEEQELLRQWIGFDTQLDEQSGLVLLPVRR